LAEPPAFSRHRTEELVGDHGDVLGDVYGDVCVPDAEQALAGQVVAQVHVQVEAPPELDLQLRQFVIGERLDEASHSLHLPETIRDEVGDDSLAEAWGPQVIAEAETADGKIVDEAHSPSCLGEATLAWAKSSIRPAAPARS